MTKDISKISSTPTLTVPVTLDEDIVGYKKLNLIAKINHSGNLARGHHTSFIKSTSSSWFHCNDFAVIPSNETALNNDTFYFFPKKLYLENMRKRERELLVSKCWSLQEFCIPALCIAANSIFLTCVSPSIFKVTNYHWWPFWTSSEGALLVTQSNS